MSDKEDKIIFFQPDQELGKPSFLAQEGISAGFPSPADDFKELRISIDREVVKNEEATFYARVSGESMQGAGLDDGDLLVIDRSLEPQDSKIAVCFIDGEFTVKRLKVQEDCVYLIPENPKYQPIKVTEENELIIWGMVTYVVKKFRLQSFKNPCNALSSTNTGGDHSVFLISAFHFVQQLDGELCSGTTQGMS